MRLLAIALLLPAVLSGQAPANTPARVVVTDSTVELHYGGALVFSGEIHAPGGATLVRLVDTTGDRVTQVLKWTARDGVLVLRGTIRGSDQAFAVEAEPREDGLRVVRHQVGPAMNRLDRAVYDRHLDWLLSVDQPARVELLAMPEVTPGVGYGLRASGGELSLRFRPLFYQRHRGLAEYRPWEYRPWSRSVAGWTSWYAFFDKVTAADIQRTADVLAEQLAPYGYRYLQIDDGYQQSPIGLPSHWLTANNKFPDGIAALSRYISDRGLEPGIWTNVAFADGDAAKAHPDWFVRDADGTPAHGNWVGYVMNGGSTTNDTLITPVYSALRRMGWSYFKLDALRHLRYEGYNSHAEWFTAQGLDREAVFRRVVQRVREAIGPEAYLLACWGIRPELIGLVDAMRVGDDGFGYGSFAQYNSFNNVVWRNDPDHIEIHRSDGYKAATLTSLTGSVLMLTDQPEVYRTDRVEAARRTAPVLFTRPGQVYDVDPSRSSLFAMVGAEVSGSGPRPFDADQREAVSLYQLDIARSFDRWTVLGRTSDAPAVIPLAELGLMPAADYLGFEFWTKRSLGVVRDTLRPGPIDPRYQVQVICLRARLAHPQLVATDRHVTCGGQDLQALDWTGTTLSGTSDLVAGDPYTLYLSEDPAHPYLVAEATGARVTNVRIEHGLRLVRLESELGGVVRWRVRYR